MSEMTLEQAYEQGWRAAADWADRDDLVYDIGSPAYKKDRQDRIARLTRAPMQVTDDLIDFVAKIIADHLGHGMREKCERTARDIVEPLSARLDQPVVAPDGLTSDVFGDWCNTLTHAYMYVNERSLENAKHGIELVLDDLREWQEKLSQPHPQAAQGGEFQGEAEPFCYAVVQKNRLSQGAMYRTRVEALADGLADWEIDEVIPLYTHPTEHAAVQEGMVQLPLEIALRFAGALDESIDGLLAASVDRQPTKLGRERQADRLAIVRAAKHVFEIAMNWKGRNVAAPTLAGKGKG